MSGLAKIWQARLLAVLLACACSPLAARGQGSTPGARGYAGAEAAVERSGSPDPLLSEIWPDGVRHGRLSEIGRGKALVFSPDLSVPSNRAFYERLGFAYFEDADWRKVLGQVRAHNQSHPEAPIEVLILETHGTNGNGLKLQDGHSPGDARSYLSVGALQEALEGAGVRLCVITACNAGRLFRPRIYKRLDARTRDPLFLPATRGVVNASPGYDPAGSRVRVLYPAKSALETVNEGDTSELSRAAREALLPAGDAIGTKPGAGHLRFVVSDILIQMLLRDPRLRLNAGGYVARKSKENFTDGESEGLFQQFLDYLDEVARRE